MDSARRAAFTITGMSKSIPSRILKRLLHRVARILPGVGIDGAVSPRLTAARDILSHVRGENIESVATFSDSEVEAVELVVSATGFAAGKTLREMGLSRDVIVGAVIRGTDAFVPRGDTLIEAGDRLIAIAQPRAMSELTELAG